MSARGDRIKGVLWALQDTADRDGPFVSARKAKRINKLGQVEHLTRVRLAAIHPTQANVDPDKVARMAQQDSSELPTPSGTIRDGGIYTLDGHHRIEAEKMKGSNAIDMWLSALEPEDGISKAFSAMENDFQKMPRRSAKKDNETPETHAFRQDVNNYTPHAERWNSLWTAARQHLPAGHPDNRDVSVHEAWHRSDEQYAKKSEYAHLYEKTPSTARLARVHETRHPDGRHSHEVEVPDATHAHKPNVMVAAMATHFIRAITNEHAHGQASPNQQTSKELAARVTGTKRLDEGRKKAGYVHQEKIANHDGSVTTLVQDPKRVDAPKVSTTAVAGMEGGNRTPLADHVKDTHELAALRTIKHTETGDKKDLAPQELWESKHVARPEGQTHVTPVAGVTHPNYVPKSQGGNASDKDPKWKRDGKMNKAIYAEHVWADSSLDLVKSAEVEALQLCRYAVTHPDHGFLGQFDVAVAPDGMAYVGNQMLKGGPASLGTYGAQSLVKRLREEHPVISGFAPLDVDAMIAKGLLRWAVAASVKDIWAGVKMGAVEGYHVGRGRKIKRDEDGYTPVDRAIQGIRPAMKEKIGNMKERVRGVGDQLAAKVGQKVANVGQLVAAKGAAVGAAVGSAVGSAAGTVAGVATNVLQAPAAREQAGKTAVFKFANQARRAVMSHPKLQGDSTPIIGITWPR
jgi:hypothetical protein